MTRQLFVLAILANLALAQLLMTPVMYGPKGRKYITFEGQKYRLRNGKNPTVTLQSKSGNCIVKLDVALNKKGPYRQVSQLCNPGIPDKEWKKYMKERLARKSSIPSSA